MAVPRPALFRRSRSPVGVHRRHEFCRACRARLSPANRAGRPPASASTAGLGAHSCQNGAGRGRSRRVQAAAPIRRIFLSSSQPPRNTERDARSSVSRIRNAEYSRPPLGRLQAAAEHRYSSSGVAAWTPSQQPCPAHTINMAAVTEPGMTLLALGLWAVPMLSTAIWL